MRDREGKVGGQTLSGRVREEALGATPTPGKRTLVQRAVGPAPSQTVRAPAAITAPPPCTPRLPPYAAIQRLFGRHLAAKTSGHDATDVHAAAAEGTAGPAGPLPHLEHIQRAFGRHDVRQVQAHQDDRAATAAQAMGATAFATEDHVAFAGTPSLHTAAHEAAHVIQQRSGVQLASGVGQNGDAYEQHADIAADKVVRGESAEAVLDQVTGVNHHVAAVQRKAKNATTTPAGLPDPAPAASIAPPESEPHFDAEGNKIVEDGGHWHLAEPPKAISFPIAPNYKYQLLPINPNQAYTALHAHVTAIQAEQLAYANSLKGDMKYWFAKVYYFVTTHELAAIEAGAYQYPHMKMQEVAQFHTAYKTNLDAWRDGNKDKVEAHWKKAFAAAESEQGGTWYKPRSMELMRALLPSMQAHIRFDLPRAIATCFVDHYAGIPNTNIGDFRSDFEAMGPVFDRAQASLLSEIKDDTWVVDPGHYGGVQDLGFPFIFNVPGERDRTFEKATRLAGGLRTGETNARYMKAMRANTQVAHPNSGSDDFSVDGSDIGNQFDWMHQPGARSDPAAPAPNYESAPAPPPFPAKLFFKQGRGQGDDSLEHAIRDDQDLASIKALAEWTRRVRGAEIVLEGHASAEGEGHDNANLARSRAFLVKFFMWHCGADVELNHFVEIGMGETGASSTPAWRFVAIRVSKNGTGRQQHNAINPNLPSEATP